MQARVPSGYMTWVCTGADAGMSVVRIALANLEFPDTPDDSVGLAEAAIGQAARDGAASSVFQRCTSPAIVFRGTRAAPDAAFLARAWAAISRAAADANVAVVLGTEHIVDERPRITTLVFNADGSLAGFQDKVQLDPSEEPFYHARRRASAVQRRPADVWRGDLSRGISLSRNGSLVCPARRPRRVSSALFSWAEAGSYRPRRSPTPRNTFHEKAVLCRAAENTFFLASVNYATEGSPTTSVVAPSDGTVLAWQPYGKEGLLVVDVETEEATGFLASRYRPT